MIEVLSESGLRRAKASGKFIGDVLKSLRERTKPGVNLLDIDEWTRQMIEDAGAVSCYVDYAPSFGEGPFEHYICTSVNDAVLHGKPRDHTLSRGDLLSLDFAASLDGVVADAAISFVVGEPGSDEDQKMIAATEDARAAGIAAAVVGNKIGDISHAVGEVLRGRGFTVNTDFGGHGVGSTMHQEPSIPNDGRPGRGFRLRPGMLIAIEPWVMADTDKLVVDADDGWTLRSATGCRTAHSEHTIAITDDGPQILTV